jgi:hypothetical protein
MPKERLSRAPDARDEKMDRQVIIPAPARERFGVGAGKAEPPVKLQRRLD